MDSLERAAAEAQERLATVHQRVTCPTCWAPRGVRCRRMPRGYVAGQVGAELKFPHVKRLHVDGSYLR